MSEAIAVAQKRTLHEISGDYAEFEYLMNSIDLDEIGDDQRQQIDAFLAALNTERDKKFDNCGSLIKEWEAIGKAQVEEGNRIEALGKAKQNKAKWLKTRLHEFMKAHGVEKAIETLRFKFARTGNGGERPVHLSARAENAPVELPEQYRRVIYQPNLETIRQDLERRDVIEKTFNVLETIGQIEKMHTVGGISLSEDLQNQYDALQSTLAAFDKKFVEEVEAYDESVLADMLEEKKDLDALLDDVAELGVRGEHLRIR